MLPRRPVFDTARYNANDYAQLRECFDLLGFQEETNKHDPLDTPRRRVLYWLLFMTERYHHLRQPWVRAEPGPRTSAFHRGRPISLSNCTPAFSGRHSLRYTGHDRPREDDHLVHDHR